MSFFKPRPASWFEAPNAHKRYPTPLPAWKRNRGGLIAEATLPAVASPPTRMIPVPPYKQRRLYCAATFA
jgi:hypothetical protein